MRSILLATPLLPLLLASCSESAGDSSLTISVEAEDVIQSGLVPGDSVENISDGWTVKFSKYIVAIGPVELELPESDAHAHAEESFFVDLTQIPGQGTPLWKLEGLESGRWDLSYETPHGASERHESVSEEDFEVLNEEGATYWVEGKITQSSGVSCPPTHVADIPSSAVEDGESDLGYACYKNAELSFSWRLEADTLFGPCGVDGLPGVAVSSSGNSNASLSIHGDHIFFNGFPTGAEGGIKRLAQWLADCDLNLDGEVTADELSALSTADVLDSSLFQLGGSPVENLDSMLTYVRAQLKTQGHFQGEGECPIDGAEHDH